MHRHRLHHRTKRRAQRRGPIQDGGARLHRHTVCKRPQLQLMLLHSTTPDRVPPRQRNGSSKGIAGVVTSPQCTQPHLHVTHCTGGPAVPGLAATSCPSAQLLLLASLLHDRQAGRGIRRPHQTQCHRHSGGDEVTGSCQPQKAHSHMRQVWPCYAWGDPNRHHAPPCSPPNNKAAQRGPEEAPAETHQDASAQAGQVCHHHHHHHKNSLPQQGGTKQGRQPQVSCKGICCATLQGGAAGGPVRVLQSLLLVVWYMRG